jgi:molybdate transport repressor ModE-like protein
MTDSRRPPWLGIELRHLAALSAIAREGSFRGAADSLGYVQSAVSQQLGQLEQLVGTRLVERRRGVAPVALTEAGHTLLSHFEEILGRFAAAQADIEALADGRAGRLRVGVFEAVAARLVPRALSRLRRVLPGVTVQMEESRRPFELAAAVEAGELDLAFGVTPLPPGPFEAREVLRDPYVLLAPAGWDLPELPSATDIERMPLVGASADRRAEEALEAHGVEARTIVRSGIDSAVHEMVGAGLGVAIVPRLAAGPPDAATVQIPLDHLVEPRRVVVFWHAERRHGCALEAFVDGVTHACLEAFTEGRNYMLAA